MADEIPLADRIRAVCRVFGVTVGELDQVRSRLPLDSEDREGPPVRGDTE